MKQEGMGKEINHKRLLNSGNKLRVAVRQGAGIWGLRGKGIYTRTWFIFATLLLF